MRTVEEIKAELKKKQECLDALYLHQRTKGDKLPNGQSAFDYACLLYTSDAADE